MTGTDAVMALANLALLTGNIGYGSGGLYALQDDCNGQGACDMGVVPSFLPGYQSTEDPQALKRFAARWGSFHLSGPGLTAVEMIQQADAGKIKAMYIVGENPALVPIAELIMSRLARDVVRPARVDSWRELNFAQPRVTQVIDAIVEEARRLVPPEYDQLKRAETDASAEYDKARADLDEARAAAEDSGD